MVLFRHRSWHAVFALLGAATVQVKAGGIYLAGNTNAPGTAASVQYSGGPDVIPSTPNPGFYASFSPGSTVSPGTLPLGLTTGSLGTSSTATGYGTAYSTADAEIATGILRISADSFGPFIGGGYNYTALSAGATAALTDLVTWTINDGASSALVGFNMHVSGAISVEPGSTGGSFNDAACFTFGPSGYGFSASNAGVSVGGGGCGDGSGYSSFTVTNQTATGFDASATFAVTNGMQSRLIAELMASCQAGDSCDFTHTGSFNFVLPSDVTFTSSSGVLLSQTGSTAPEPGTWALIGLGLGCLGLVQRRRAK